MADSSTSPEPVPPLPGAARPPPPLTWRERVELLTGPERRPPPAWAAAVVVATILVAVVLTRGTGGGAAEITLPLAGGPGDVGTTTTVAADVLVHAAGAVRAPGVYRLAAGARVADVVDAAGGPADGADLDRLNLAAPVADGAQVYVPREGEAPPAGASGTSNAAGGPAAVIDLNTATLAELDTLPGVGPATAAAIVQERERRGGFGTVDDLLDVRGIGPARLEALRDLVRV